MKKGIKIEFTEGYETLTGYIYDKVRISSLNTNYDKYLVKDSITTTAYMVEPCMITKILSV